MLTPRLLRLGLIAIAGISLLSACSSPSSGKPAQPQKMAMADMPDFVQNAPPTVQEAYQYAITDPHALETVPCYCGCGKMGHISNRSCYIKDIAPDGKITFDSHASGCGICVEITDDVMRLKSEGKTPREIRTFIDDKYSQYGPGTNTALPTD